MDHTRLARGFVVPAVLLAVLLVPTALLADPAASAGPALSAATPSPTPSAEATTAPAEREPKLSKAQRRARRVARKRRLVLDTARRQLGVRYVYGGASRRGFDCSGLALYVYRSLGRSLPHGATDQSRRGKRVSLRRLEIGDLVFYGGSGYYHHVGIYAGRGRIIHAPRSGAVVSYARVGDAATARRLIGD
jgi:cell wall-associated NlpC family hydrolase